MRYRHTTSADLAEQLERRHPADERERFIRSGDWRGPTMFWNMQEGYNSHDRIVEIYTDYKAVPEEWPAEVKANYPGGHVTDYWEIVPANHPDGEPSHAPRDHVGSWCNEIETKKQLRRLQESQWRMQIVLAVKELEKVKAPESVIAIVKSRMFQYPVWINA